MTQHAIEHLAGAMETHHRRALLTLGVGGLAAALAGASATAAKQGSGKQRKKQCKRLQQSCVRRVRNYCASFGDDATACLDDLLHCCDHCDVGAGIICVIEGITILQ